MLTTEPHHSRWLIKADLPACVEIDEAHARWDAWAPEDFEAALRSLAVIGRVAEVDGAVVGFTVYLMDEPLRQVRVLRLAVAPRWRRRGVGRQLLRRLAWLVERGGHWGGEYDRVVVRVPERETAAALFLRACSFRAVLEGDQYLFTYTRPELRAEKVVEISEGR